VARVFVCMACTLWHVYRLCISRGENAYEIDHEGTHRVASCKASGTHCCHSEGTRVYIL